MVYSPLAYFSLMRYMVASVGQKTPANHKSEQILNFRGCCALSPIRAKFGMQQWKHGVLFISCQISPSLAHYVTPFRWKTANL